MVFGEKRGDTVPGGMCTRMAMQKQDRRSRTAVPDTKRRLGQLDCLKPETFEHQLLNLGCGRRFRPLEQERCAAVGIERQLFCCSSRKRRAVMNSIIWLVGAVVIVLAIMSFFGLR